MKEEKELGLPPTVTEEDIKHCIKQAEEIEASLREEISTEENVDDKYHIYRTEKATDKVFLK